MVKSTQKSALSVYNPEEQENDDGKFDPNILDTETVSEAEENPAMGSQEIFSFQFGNRILPTGNYTGKLKESQESMFDKDGKTSFAFNFKGMPSPS